MAATSSTHTEVQQGGRTAYHSAHHILPHIAPPDLQKGETKIADATEKKVVDSLGDEYRKLLWKTRAYLPFQGPPPDPVNFPNPNDVAGEVGRLKARLREQAQKNGNTVDLRLRETNYKAGMFFGRPNDPTATTADSLTLDQIGQGSNDGLITVDLLRDYYAQVGARPQDSHPIPHDGVHLNQELWLPGLFVIDQIFAALVAETWTKCVKFNETKSPAAQADLSSFVEGISKGPGENTNQDAAKFLPFINYQGDAKDKTWINLVNDVTGSVVGALIHVHDWAAGTHSNGTGIP